MSISVLEREDLDPPEGNSPEIRGHTRKIMPSSKTTGTATMPPSRTGLGIPLRRRLARDRLLLLGGIGYWVRISGLISGLNSGIMRKPVIIQVLILAAGPAAPETSELHETVNPGPPAEISLPRLGAHGIVGLRFHWTFWRTFWEDGFLGAIEELQERVIRCTRCPRLVAHCRSVAEKRRPMYREWDYWGKPLPAFGSADARLLILGLAPAAHGGNRTGRMFTGDRSGDWVFGTLHKFGFASSPDSQRRDDGLFLKDAYITAALRCAPPANKPLPEELLNCRPYLVEELRLLTGVRIVVALGKISFDTFLRTWSGDGHRIPSPRPRFGHGATYELPDGPVLMGSYHPSQQNTQTGRLTREMFESIFAKAREILS